MAPPAKEVPPSNPAGLLPDRIQPEMSKERRWRIIEAPDPKEEDLTSAELFGISVVLGQASTGDDVYYRAWKKIQAAVTETI